MTRTAGIDLASRDRTTAACVIDWSARPTVVSLRPEHVSDRDIVDLADEADATGIDAPFGWPRPFTDALAAYAAGGPFPGPRSDALWLRATDAHAYRVSGGRAPLSVSSDRIARPAARAALLLSDLGRDGRSAARDGADGVLEVYPAGAMRCWGLDTTGYKAPDAVEIRERLVARIVEAVGLVVSAPDLRLLARTDHALDALVAALVARAFLLGLVLPPPPDLTDLVRIEGWLFLPTGSLADLPG